MRITSAGNVGIGTATPAALLDVRGTVQVGEDDTGYDVKFFGASAGAFMLYDESADTLDVRGATAAGPGVLKLTTGELTNVDGGILGRLEFQAPLDCAGTDACLVAASIWGEAAGTFAAACNKTDLVFATADSETAAEKMRITSAGNVGIGTASPARLLTVESTASTFMTVKATDGNSSASYLLNNDVAQWQLKVDGGDSDKFKLSEDNVLGATALTVDTSGNVGIGTTTPNALLDVNYDNDVSAKIGKAHIGYAGSGFEDVAIFSHVDQNTTSSYALFQSANGQTYLNSASGQGLYLAINNATKLIVDTSGNVGIGTGAPTVAFDIYSSTNVTQQINRITYATATGSTHWPQQTRAANSSMYFFYATSGGTSDTEFNLRGDGNAYADGTWNDNGADYAEFFESTTGIALDQGRTVVLDECKVRYYDASSGDAIDDIIGVVRPSAWSKNSMVIGNTAWNMHHDKYLTDDWGVYILSDVPVKSWTDSETNKEYAVYENPPPGVDIDPDYNWNTAPAYATITCQAERTLNPNYSYDCDYVNREDRPEWNIIGLLGQVHVCTGQTVNSRWLKMHDISCNVQLWLVR